MLSQAPLLVGLLRLVGWGVRLHPFLGGCGAAGARRGLLRTQALHAAARQLAAATEGLQRGPQPPSDTCRRQALACLCHVVALIAQMTFLAARLRGRGLFGRLLAAALAESAVLEHAARLLLVLLPSGQQASAPELASISPNFAASYLNCAALIAKATPAAAAAPSTTAAASGQLRRVLSGPCARHAALVLGLAALRELEGRPAGQGAPCPLLALPGRAAPEVAAALAGGALPFLERLLRRAGEAPEGLEACLLSYYPLGDSVLPLLAYGEPLQAAAFVATATKLLRRTDASLLLRGKLLGNGVGDFMSMDLITAIWDSLHDTPAASPPLGRLALVLSLALPEWLPELSRLVRQAAEEDEEAWRQEQQQRRQEQRRQRQQQRSGRCRQQRREAVEAPSSGEGTSLEGLEDLLFTVQGLLLGLYFWPRATARAQSLGMSASPSATTAAPGLSGVSGPVASQASSADPLAFSDRGGSSGVSDGGRGGWRPGLLEETELVAVMGATLGLLQRRRPNTESWGHLYGHTAVWAECIANTREEEVLWALEDERSAATWQPGAVRGVAEVLRGMGGRTKLAVAMERLAKQLEAWASGEEAGGLALGEWEVQTVSGSPGTLGATLEALLVPPAEARRRLGLPACSNPACANLAGDSEAGLRLQKCGGCGQASYCCRECQTAHWRSGYKEACASGSGSGMAG
ncbi:hypothetical protein HYH03_001253 [Edaphochlamys debaryana]|uniref:phytol kinase n=1 Tax=Edaphochlamys debaryana TaxID=47281 RepID=A0A836C700_9CHLO|nr:hypothetical protein HYH03_001253 [Edaphochlamys debaryana]|eukprot:KAG2501474.1 hypothetical protein HYH03_001253 [Edaphochlamys debaryana]